MCSRKIPQWTSALTNKYLRSARSQEFKNLNQIRFMSLTTGAAAPSNPNETGQKKEPNVVVEYLRDLTLIAINRPEKRNCVNPETARELIAAFKAFEEDPNSPVAVLYGKGGTFCAGFDLEHVASNQEQLNFEDFFSDGVKGNGPMGPSRRFFKKPVVAAINGYAVAGGLELALMCDLRVAEENAVMGVFCRRFGVPLIDGGTVRLPHLIGLSRALDMILTGRAVSGKEAFDFGLVNKLTQVGTAVGQAVQLAGSLTKFPQRCMNIDRESAYNSVYNAQSFEEAVQFELEKGIDVIREESVPGATSFVKGVGRHGSFHLNDAPDFNSKL